MKKSFGCLPSGQAATLYSISCGNITAKITDYGAHLVSLFVPDRKGKRADVVLGFDDCNGYRNGEGFLGAVVGRSANRIAKSEYAIGNLHCTCTPNEGANNLHSGPDFYHLRMWKVTELTKSSITLSIHSPDGDQGYPGNADISVTYRLDLTGGLHIIYDAVCDQDTIFNLTNHSYFNLAGHTNGNAMTQLLTIPGRFFTPADAESIPTGEERSVVGTPFDFRSPKPIGQDIEADYEPLHLQGGYDHNFEVFCNPCAVLTDPVSGRTMSVHTDCPGLQLYAGNFIGEQVGKGGYVYRKRSGICLETQFFPDSIHKPQWAQPVVKAGTPYHSETVYRFESL